MIKNGTTLDSSTANQGYIRIKHKPGSKRRKVRISMGQQIYTYDLNNRGDFETYPLQMGNGTYKITVYEQTQGTKYAQRSSFSIRVHMSDLKLPYLYPNQYVWYEDNSSAIVKSNELCGNLSNNAAKLKVIEKFIVNTFLYDYMKALTIRSSTTYLPNVDTILKTRKGICFDFAALFACMLRAQGIPAQLVIGYADNAYHAWNRVWVDGAWKLVDTTSQIANMSIRKYTPQKYY